jgi:hypothetical protein
VALTRVSRQDSKTGLTDAKQLVQRVIPSEDLLCATICGEAVSNSVYEGDLEGLVEAAFHHGLHLVLLEAIKSSSTWTLWPLRLRETLEDQARIASCVDLVREQELKRVLSRFNRSGVELLLLKGVPLSYTLYRSPALRPRCDTDFLIRDGDLERVEELLRECGYSTTSVQANKASYERLYRRKDSFGICHSLDLHWKINNAPLFADTLTFDELHAEAIPVAALGPHALGLGHVHALLLACMHRFAHAHAPFYVGKKRVYAGDHLRWVYDIHLLCSALRSEQWSKFLSMAGAKNIAVFCADALNAATQAFNTKLPAGAIQTLQTAALDETACLQRLKASEAAWLLANLRAFHTFQQRLAFVKGACFPPLAYMREKYQSASWLALPFLYGYRFVMGALRATKILKMQK